MNRINIEVQRRKEYCPKKDSRGKKGAERRKTGLE